MLKDGEDIVGRALVQAFSEIWPLHRGLSYSWVDIEVEDLGSAIRWLGGTKLRNATGTLQMLLEEGSRPYSGAVSPEGGIVHLGVITEKIGAEVVILDGTHRVRAAHDMGLKSLRVCLLSASSAPPFCSDRTNIDELVVVTKSRNYFEVFPDLNKSDYRPMPAVCARAIKIIRADLKG